MTRTINDFSRPEMREICNEYVNSRDGSVRTRLCQKYDITSNVFYAILRKSVIESVVSDDIVNKMSIRAAQNTSRHGGIGAYCNTLKAYAKYIEQRKEFEFSPVDKIFYVIEYANSQMSSDSFIAKYCIERELFNRTITSAIVEGLVNDTVVNALEYKAMQFNDPIAVHNHFDTLRTRRNDYKFFSGGRKACGNKSTSKNKGLKNKKKIKLDKMQQLEFDEMEKEFYAPKQPPPETQQLEFVKAEKESYNIPSESDEYEASIKSSYMKKTDD